jgi:hypothetical protein
VNEASIRNAIVFVKDLPGDNETAKTVNRHNYLSVAFRNDPVIEKGNIIYVRSLGDARDKELSDVYRGRNVFLFEYTDGINSFHVVPYTPKLAFPER